MTEQEAMQGIKNEMECVLSEHSTSYFDECLEVAYASMEKQIAKKDKNDCGRCVACGTYNNFIINKLANPKAHLIIHCWNCGQAIDWGNEDAE